MAWATPRTWTTSEIVTAAMMNQDVRDNMNALKSTSAEVDTNETTTSTAFADLATTGPAVTINTGTTAFVLMSAKLSNTNDNAVNIAGVAVSGATTLAAADGEALFITAWEASEPNTRIQVGIAFPLSGLTAGSNTFTMKYRVSAGTGTFGQRKLTVIGV